ncbi:hypothetical protein ACJX0J_019761, partial [Zea mays]
LANKSRKKFETLYSIVSIFLPITITPFKVLRTCHCVAGDTTMMSGTLPGFWNLGGGGGGRGAVSTLMIAYYESEALLPLLVAQLLTATVWLCSLGLFALT